MKKIKQNKDEIGYLIFTTVSLIFIFLSISYNIFGSIAYFLLLISMCFYKRINDNIIKEHENSYKKQRNIINSLIDLNEDFVGQNIELLDEIEKLKNISKSESEE